MKLKTLLTILTTAAISLNVAFAAEEDTALSKEMKSMNKILRTVKRQVGDPSKKEENLALLTTVKKNIEESHKLDPVKIKDVPEGERKAYKESYNKALDELDKTFDQLAAAIKADNQDEAKKLFEKLSEEKEEGHKKFAPEE